MPNNSLNVKHANRLSKLLDKIQRRLGLMVIKLPDELDKESWKTIIEEDSIPVFSRFFPHEVVTIIDNNCRKDGWFFIDRDLPEGSTILGVKDIEWQTYRNQANLSNVGFGGFQNWDFIASEYGIDDIAFSQMRANYMSLFNLGIYIEFQPPNKIKLVSVNGSLVSNFRPFPIAVFLHHPINLSTISPTMFNTFEDLCTADVANYLYDNLKYYDGIDTVFGNIDLKLDKIQDWANKRENIIDKLNESYVSTANENQLIMMTV